MFLEVKKVINNWDEAYREIVKHGYIDVSTGGGNDYNQSVTKQLADNIKKKVLFVGASPGYNQDGTVFRYTLEVKNNKQASTLLSKEY